MRNVRISNYLNSLYSLARLLRQSGKYQDATDDVLEEIVKMIREYVGDLKREGKYDDMDLLTIGTINDMYTEMQNDEKQGAYSTLASQDDMDRF